MSITTVEDAFRKLMRDHDRECENELREVFLAGATAGLEKAGEICRYWKEAPMRSAASKATCDDIEISCLATAGRLRRGEYENPTSEVMSVASDVVSEGDK